MDVDSDNYRSRQRLVSNQKGQDPSCRWNFKSIEILIVLAYVRRVGPAADNLSRIIQATEKVVTVEKKLAAAKSSGSGGAKTQKAT